MSISYFEIVVFSLEHPFSEYFVDFSEGNVHSSVVSIRATAGLYLQVADQQQHLGFSYPLVLAYILIWAAVDGLQVDPESLAQMSLRVTTELFKDLLIRHLERVW